MAGAFRPLKHEHIPLTEGLALNFLTRLLWRYAEREAGDQLGSLAEPAFGNPPAIRDGERLISQDLANSVLEYRSYADVARGCVCELGGGYGRNAFVTASLAPVDRYIMADISPAIGIAQQYLTTVFPDRKHFLFRPFADFESVREEFEAARDMAALAREQNEKLEKRIAELEAKLAAKG
jgi:putative sugar O-methyltransferase